MAGMCSTLVPELMQWFIQTGVIGSRSNDLNVLHFSFSSNPASVAEFS
jgi:hypothetical protein